MSKGNNRGQTLALSVAAHGQTQTVSAEIRKIAGQPVVHVDGKPFPLLWGAVAREKRPDLLPHFGDMPLTAVTVHIHYGAWHPRRGEYNFTAFDRVAEEYRRENPDAYFIWDLTVYPPHDFAKRHPDHMASDDEGDTSSIGRFCWSYASRPAVEELKEMVESAIRYVEASSYANRVIGDDRVAGVGRPFGTCEGLLSAEQSGILALRFGTISSIEESARSHA